MTLLSYPVGMRGIVLLTIFLITSSCKSFRWEAKPYSADYQTQSIYRTANEDEVSCSQPRFNEFTCFDAQNIADLKTAIERVNGIKKKDKKKLLKYIDAL